jgi:Flp pilus assembly protein TadD
MDPTIRQEAIDLIQRADLLMLDGDDVTARNLLVKAVEIDPENAEARRMLGGVTARMAGVSLDEVPAGRQYLKNEANDMIASARDAEANGQFDLAISLLRRALSIDPENAEAQHRKSFVETLKSQLAE